MKLQKETHNIQEQLGKFCKTGKEVQLPGVTEGRLKHYRRLVYNVVKGAMDQAYPIASSALGDEQWDRLVDDFFANHQAKSAQIWKLPYEFYEYHHANHTALSLNTPWLNDLLWFEWSEIEVYSMPDRDPLPYTKDGDALHDIIRLNPEYEILQLDYPVHHQSLQGIEKKKGTYYVLLFREPETGNVRFMALSVLHAFILMKISEEAIAINDFKGEIASIASVESEKYLDTYLRDFIGDLMEKKMVFGFAEHKL